MMRRCFTLLLTIVLAVLIAPRSSRADQSTAHSVSVAVLSFDSDDAEEQADALTGALRSRIRASQGWSLIDAPQPLGMLTAALRCPGKPLTPECQQKVSEQIKAERYIFGYVVRGPQAGQVTAEIHLFQRGKAEVVIKEGYADNLKDQNDDTLRKIAQRALERLGGSAVGVVVVKSGDKDGEVIVDGSKRVPLKDGAARIELAAGGHSIEVSSSTGTQKRNVLVQAGKESLVEMASATPIAATPAADDKPFPTRKVVGWGLMGLAAVGAGVAIWQWQGPYSDAKQRGDDLAGRFQSADVETACAKGPTGTKEEKDVCQADSDARRSSGIAIASAAVGGASLIVGSILLFTDLFSGDSAEKKAGSNKPRVVPSVGKNGGTLFLTGTF